MGAMVTKSRTIPAVLAVVGLTAFLTGCFHRCANSPQATGNPAAAEFATTLHNKVTADALKVKAAQLGQIKEMTEDPQAGSLTIVVEV